MNRQDILHICSLCLQARSKTTYHFINDGLRYIGTSPVPTKIKETCSGAMAYRDGIQLRVYGTSEGVGVRSSGIYRRMVHCAQPRHSDIFCTH